MKSPDTVSAVEFTIVSSDKDVLLMKMFILVFIRVAKWFNGAFKLLRCNISFRNSQMDYFRLIMRMGGQKFPASKRTFVEFIVFRFVMCASFCEIYFTYAEFFTMWAYYIDVSML